MNENTTCSRCPAPQGRIVILNNRQAVCGACIDAIANVLAVADSISIDMTSSIECGVIA